MKRYFWGLVVLATLASGCSEDLVLPESEAPPGDALGDVEEESADGLQDVDEDGSGDFDGEGSAGASCKSATDCADEEGAENCLSWSCQEGECVSVNAADGTFCDDGNACSETSECKNGECVSTVPDPRDDGEACTEDSCDPEVGCTNQPIGQVCDDGIRAPPTMDVLLVCVRGNKSTAMTTTRVPQTNVTPVPGA